MVSCICNLVSIYLCRYLVPLYPNLICLLYYLMVYTLFNIFNNLGLKHSDMKSISYIFNLDIILMKIKKNNVGIQKIDNGIHTIASFNSEMCAWSFFY